MTHLRFLRGGISATGLAVVSLLIGACGGAGGSNPIPPGTLTLSLSTSTVVAAQDGSPGTVGVSLGGITTGSSVTVAASNLPSGVTSQFAPAAGGLSGTLSLTAGSTSPAGTYSASVTATSGNQTASQPFMLVIAIAASVGSNVDISLGVGGKLEAFMSTSFQPAEWDYQFFQNHTATEPALLNKLGPQHIRLQGLRSEEHTSELQSLTNLVCRLL